MQQAARAYEIAELRYREGLSTQLELSDSRLLLAQAQVNRARAARDLQIDARASRAAARAAARRWRRRRGGCGDGGRGGGPGIGPKCGGFQSGPGVGQRREPRRSPAASRCAGSAVVTMTRHVFSFVAGSIVLTPARSLASACGQSATPEASAAAAPAAIEIGRENVVDVQAQPRSASGRSSRAS